MKIYQVVIPILLAIALVGCNLPTGGNPVEPTFPVPNQTMTALFSTPLPTLVMTQQPGVVTATPSVSSATSAPTLQATTPVEPAPTNTQAPQATATPKPTQALPSATPDLSHRTVTSVTAAYMSTPPVIDGDWNDLPAKEYPAEIVVFGAANWSGRDDLAASFKIGWDASYLYLGVKVRDDVFVQNATGQDLFKGDSLEVLMDTNVPGDFYYNVDSADDFQLGISPGDQAASGAPEAYLWLPATVAGSRTSSVKIAFNRSDADGITRYEVAIPWSLYAIQPRSGDHYGFALSASDNDNPSKNVQQSMVSNVKTRVLTDPTTWGDLTLK